MIEFNPKINHIDVDCPIYNSEWYNCNIIKCKCPKAIETDNEDIYDIPDNCPAKKGIIIKILPEK